MTLTPHSFFNIVLKIFGLFFLKDVINEIPVVFSTFIRYFTISDSTDSIGILVVSLLVLVFYVVLVLQLLFRTNKIINSLKLDKGFFEPEFSLEQKQEQKLNLTKEDMFTMALVIVGGYTLVEEIPNFCRDFYLYFDQRNSLYGGDAPGWGNIISCAAKILLALLIIGERKRIVDFITGKNKVEMEEDSAE